MSDATFDLDRFQSIPRLSGLVLSPAGDRIVVSIAQRSADGKKMVSALWDVDPAGDRPARRLTRSAPGESGAAFLRDGSLVFLSSRPDPEKTDEGDDAEPISALWLLPAGGGEARLLAAPPGGVDAVVTARDADIVVFAASVMPGATTLSDDAEREKARKKAGVAALLFESYPIRLWDHYLGPRDRHLFAATVPQGDERITDPVDLTPNAGQALNEREFDVTPDGSTIVTGWGRFDDLKRIGDDIVAIDRATGEHRVLTPRDGYYEGPAVSPDGQTVACSRSSNSTPEQPQTVTLWAIDIASGEGRDLTPDLDLWPSHPVWSHDGGTLFFLADRQGHVAVLALDMASGETRVVASEGEFAGPSPTPDGRRLFAVRSSMAGPPRVVAVDVEGGDGTSFRPVASHPETDRAEPPGRVERISTHAEDGTEIGSWLVLPPDTTAERPAPLVVWVHGGPLGSWNAWAWRWNPHLLAARGYAVLLPDPALSLGYGQQMIDRGWGRWGEAPYTDVMAAVDAALERPELDRERTALMGGSFGGYMANWVAGQTDRFRAIVTHASLWELRGFHGTTDLGPAWEEEFGDPYTDPARYDAASPHQHVSRITTPLLVIHGELDHRVPISEALRLWTDLRRHGVESKFLYFPDENHWILKPPNQRVWYETVFSFLDQHVLGREWRRPELL
jgi:dipeptidyl aminopeptidase/acylaminoacyl peptidase